MNFQSNGSASPRLLQDTIWHNPILESGSIQIPACPTFFSDIYNGFPYTWQTTSGDWARKILKPLQTCWRKLYYAVIPGRRRRRTPVLFFLGGHEWNVRSTHPWCHAHWTWHQWCGTINSSWGEHYSNQGNQVSSTSDHKCFNTIMLYCGRGFLSNELYLVNIKSWFHRWLGVSEVVS